MSGGGGRGLQVAAVLVVLGLYAGLSHYCNLTARVHAWGAAVALAPEMIVGFLLIWRWTSLPAAVTALLAGMALEYAAWPFLSRHSSWVFLAQDASLDLVLAWGFGRSLRAGETALCTRFADQVHGPLSAAEVAYTRRVTFAWTAFFLGTLATSVALFLAAPLPLWSFFVNICVLPLIGLMFVLEYLVRLRVLPHVPRPGLLASVRVYLASPQ